MKLISSILKCLLVTWVHIVFQPMAVCGIYGPSLELLTRSDSGMRNSGTPTTLYLHNYPNHAVLLPLLEKGSTANAADVFSHFRHPHRHQLYILTPPESRIIVVIQALNLPVDDAFECEAYVGFIDQSFGVATGRICGMVSGNDQSSMPDNLLGPRYFVSDGPLIAVEINIPVHYADFEGKYDSLISTGVNNETTTVEIAFTAFTAGGCFKSSMASCSPNSSPTSGDAECVSSRLFCDGVLNCAGGPSIEFGFDEYNCSQNPYVTEVLDPEEERILQEINYRKTLREIDRWKDEEANYIMIGLSIVAITAVVAACACYWIVPNRKVKEPEEGMNGTELSVPAYFAHIDNLIADEKQWPKVPHEIETYHGNRRVTISVC